eukprot:3405741-Pyramimonas_sp.AAC.1
MDDKGYFGHLARLLAELEGAQRLAPGGARGAHVAHHHRARRPATSPLPAQRLAPGGATRRTP